MSPHVFLDGVPLLPDLACAVDVGLEFEEIELLLEFAVTAQAVGIELCFANGTAGFLVVAAVAKAALPGQVDDIGEGGIDALGIGPELQFAQAGQVHEEPVARHADELPMGGGVAASVVALAHIGGALPGFAEQCVHDG